MFEIGKSILILMFHLQGTIKRIAGVFFLFHVFDLIKYNWPQNLSVGVQTEWSYHDKGLRRRTQVRQKNQKKIIRAFVKATAKGHAGIN